MGFTALDGLAMGTRSGTIDPGVLLYLMDERKMDARAIEKLLYQQSGLLGSRASRATCASSSTRTIPCAAGRQSVCLSHPPRARLARRCARRC
jgi:acetate kinase